jgi:hypothetical protein
MENLRQSMIQAYIKGKEALRLSQELDKYIVEVMRGK